MTDLVNTLGFSDDEINRCTESGGLLSVELEFTKKCNLKCIYCYSQAGESSHNELSLEELQSVVLQAKELGAKKIILLGGGEPLIYKNLTEIVQFINRLGLEQVIFTNGTLINREVADLLLENNVSVIIKQNSFKPEVQDSLAGVQGASLKIKQGMDILREAGFPNGKVSLGTQTVICSHNIDEIPELWVWARERNIIPYVEILTLQGRAAEHSSLMVSSTSMQSLFEQLASIDSNRFGIEWEIRPNTAAFSCKRHLYSCLVNSEGYIQPCTGVDIHVGNIRETPLKEILTGSPVIGRLRNVYEHLEGRCRDCEHGKDCYGCRGNAYQVTGNYMASDPACWHCDNVKNENSSYISKQ